MASSAKRDDPVATASQITHAIAVASGLRGVGESSIAGLLAVALNRHGLRVGLLDADITGTNIPECSVSANILLWADCKKSCPLYHGAASS
jgi:Mrp family chromosome partitioning ATPase